MSLFSWQWPVFVLFTASTASSKALTSPPSTSCTSHNNLVPLSLSFFSSSFFVRACELPSSFLSHITHPPPALLDDEERKHLEDTGVPFESCNVADDGNYRFHTHTHTHARTHTHTYISTHSPPPLTSTHSPLRSHQVLAKALEAWELEMVSALAPEMVSMCQDLSYDIPSSLSLSLSLFVVLHSFPLSF
jgi:hypothetical protein